jgi:hypothetical protein
MVESTVEWTKLRFSMIFILRMNHSTQLKIVFYVTKTRKSDVKLFYGIFLILTKEVLLLASIVPMTVMNIGVCPGVSPQPEYLIPTMDYFTVIQYMMIIHSIQSI